MNTATITKISSNMSNHPIDRLGALKARIAELTAEAKPLETEIKAMGEGTHAGNLFDANVAVVADSESYDVDMLEAKLRSLGVDNRFFSKAKKIRSGGLRLTVKARR